MNQPHQPSPATHSWKILLAFLILYVGWGTTYLAIKRGVKDEHLPPGLFGGVRIASAGLVLLGWLAWRRESLHLPRKDVRVVVLAGCLLFVGGNGLITLAEKTVPSGMAAVLAATTPLWIALFSLAWRGVERPGWRGWLGVLLGFCGVLVLLWPQLQDDLAKHGLDWGPVFVLGSAAAWGLGSLVVQGWPVSCAHMTAAAWQMVIGGTALTLVGITCGELGRLPERLTTGAVLAFSYLLVIGSLMGFVAFNWLLGHVSATRVGTYAYINPVVAVLVGWLVDGEIITEWLLAGVIVILAGVALVRGAHQKPAQERPVSEEPLRADQRPGESVWCDPGDPGCSSREQQHGSKGQDLIPTVKP